MNKIILFSVVLFSLLAINLVKANGEVSNCMTLVGNNVEYRLTQNITMSSCEEGEQHCLIVNGYNITLDCQGYWLNSGNACLVAIWNRDGDGYSGGENLTIKNCIINGWSASYGIYSDYNNTVVDNCTFIANAYSVRFNSMNSILRNSNIVSSSWIFIGSNYPQEQQNYYYNNIISTYPNIEMDTLNYWNNSEGGNNWTNGVDFYSDVCANLNSDSICDEPYNLTSSVNNTDYLPLTFMGVPVVHSLLYDVLADTGSGLGGFFEAITSPLAYLIFVLAMISSIFTIFYVVATVIKKSFG
jgi:hypothetical protein